jgi:UDP:flavonoid glycosyltransferase YjiC (YdhE family)
VDQEALLKHPAVGLFLSHSGWNSVVEAAAAGVPLLAWPRGGDHRVNAMVVASGGVGVWMEQWSWDGEDRLVTGEEIREKVKEVMSDAAVRARAKKTAEEAAKAVAEGGASYRSLQEFIGKLVVK